MKDFFNKIKILDIIILSVVLFTATVAGFLVYGTTSKQLKLKIRSPKGEWIYPLDKPAVIEIQGKLGNSKIIIEDNCASITESVCPNKTCIKSGKIEKAGEWNACMPNQVFIYITD